MKIRNPLKKAQQPPALVLKRVPLRLPALPEVERLTVAAEDLQGLDIIAATFEKVQSVAPGDEGYVDVTVDAHDSVMHVPAGEQFEVDRMTGRFVDRLTGEIVAS